MRKNFLENDFTNRLKAHKVKLQRRQPEVLQLNVGKLCNITCVHCHVNAGPHRKEIISRQTIDKILPWFKKSKIPTLDLTGGTPEMVPDFRYIVESVKKFSPKRKIIDRLNPTIINEPDYKWVANFLAENKIEIVASLPCYSEKNVDGQRGNGVFDSSIKAFQKLNELGYGKDPELVLNFVYNPNGDFLPGPQEELKQDYKQELKKHFGIVFNDLYCITNMPISRFAGYLKNNGKYQDYMNLLKNAFNLNTVENLMCCYTINVSWKGEVFDCDFNQMLRMLQIKNAKNGNDHNNSSNYLNGKSNNGHSNRNGKAEKIMLWDIDIDSYVNEPILTDSHCFGCTAGSGSSCGGTLIG